MIASDFHPEVLRLFDQYVHGLIDRRGFLDGAAKYLTLGTTAAALLDALNPKFAEARQVSPNDPRISTAFIDVESPNGYGKLRAYFCQSKEHSPKRPAVLVVHENRGLNPHIEDVARRLALDGYFTLAPDALTPFGGYPGDEDRARELFAKLDQGKTREDFLASARFLKRHADASGKLGVVGFCYGGGIVHLLTTRLEDIDAGVSFYGLAPAPERAYHVRAALLVHLAENDERINSVWPAYEAALRSAHVDVEVHTYPGTQHGFNNDTTPRYDETAAKLAWSRTLAFFDRSLRGQSSHQGTFT